MDEDIRRRRRRKNGSFQEKLSLNRSPFDIEIRINNWSMTPIWACERTVVDDGPTSLIEEFHRRSSSRVQPTFCSIVQILIKCEILHSTWWIKKEKRRQTNVDCIKADSSIRNTSTRNWLSFYLNKSSEKGFVYVEISCWSMCPRVKCLKTRSIKISSNRWILKYRSCL